MAKVKFIEDAGDLWHRLWSVRLAIGAAVASGIEAGYNAYVMGVSPTMALIACGISLAAAVARIVAQPSLSRDENSTSGNENDNQTWA